MTHELFICAVLILLIAAGLYFSGGAWGIVLLWGLGLFFVLPQIGAVIAPIIKSLQEQDDVGSLLTARPTRLVTNS